MLNVFILTYFTKKLDLAIIESDNSITSKYGDYLDSIFKKVTIYDCQKNFLSDLKKNNVDILLFDNNVHDLESTFSFVKDVHLINPLIKIILFSKYADYNIFMKCLKYNISGLMTNKANEHDLKDFLKISVKKILMNSYNIFDEENKNKFEIVDCLNFLINQYPNVSLVNHYKGISIIRPAEILELNENTTTLKIDSVQIKTIKENEHIVISSKHLGVEILTEIKAIDYKLNEIVLEFDSLIDAYVHHRKNPRVEPTKKSSLIIENDNKFRVDIIDISINHVLCNLTVLNNNLKIHSNIKITIDCPFDNRFLNKNIKTIAFVKDIFYTNDGEKILLQFKLNEKDHIMLDSYIENRIKELVKELKDKTK